MSPTPQEIREWRLSRGLTQTEAGALVGSGYRTWHQWETGKRKMRPCVFELARIKAVVLANPSPPPSSAHDPHEGAGGVSRPGGTRDGGRTS